MPRHNKFRALAHRYSENWLQVAATCWLTATPRTGFNGVMPWHNKLHALAHRYSENWLQNVDKKRANPEGLAQDVMP
jgi:hypothetical protein